MNRLLSILLIVFLNLIGTAHAGTDSGERRHKYFANAAFTSGGDKFGTVTYSSGQTESIRAGGELYLGLGVIFPSLSGNLETQLGIGYHMDSATASNGEVSFDRIFIEALEFYLPGEKVRIGGGLTLHLEPQYECSISGYCGETVTFQNALGFIIQSDYMVYSEKRTSVRLGLRYTNISYDAKNYNGIPVSGSIDGNYAGLILGVYY